MVLEQVQVERARSQGGHGDHHRYAAGSRNVLSCYHQEGLGFLGLNGTAPETSGFAHSCSLLQVVEIVKKLESRQRGWEEDEDPERKGTIVFNATSEFCRTLGEIPTYGLAGNREEQEELMVSLQAAPLTDLLCSGLGARCGQQCRPQGSSVMSCVWMG